MAISLRLPDDLHAALRDYATKESRSLNSLIVYLLRRGVDAAKRQEAA